MHIFITGDVFATALVLHLIGDFVLQNGWMAKYKKSLLHPAAYVHAAIHTVLLTAVFPVWMSCLVGITHLLIDTRIPYDVWSKFFKQDREGTVGLVVAIFEDQTFHIFILGVATAVTGNIHIG